VIKGNGFCNFCRFFFFFFFFFGGGGLGMIRGLGPRNREKKIRLRAWWGCGVRIGFLWAKDHVFITMVLCLGGC
jgi:hypothetical protein